MISAIDKIGEYTSGIDFETFAADRLRVDAVIYNLIILGEAEGHVPQHVERRHPEVPWDEIRNSRNLLVHEYLDVELGVIWNTIREDLPPLRRKLERILNNDRED